MSAGPYAGLAARYLRHGYSPIPVRPGSKAPCIADWPRWCRELPPPELVEEWARRYPGAGIAIATGPASGIVALDLDHDIDGLHARVLEAAGPSPVAKRGAKGPTWFYRYSGERSRAFSRQGHAVAEILSQGRLVVVPPTLHPDTGQPYQRVTPETLLGTDPSSLPPLDAARVAALFEPVRDPPRRPRPTREQAAGRLTSAAMLADALRHIPPEEYHTWVQVGMALKAALGEDGFAMWDEWSSASPKYDTAQMPTKWRSFQAEGGITAGTLFHFAKEHGWQPPEPPRAGPHHHR